MNTIHIVLLLFIVIAVSQQSHAQGIPVYDASGFAQLIAQVDAMAEDYQKQIEQLDEAIKQREAITGARNAGDLLNGILEQQLREYLPNTWEDTLGIINANGLPQGALGTQSIYSDLINTYNPLVGSDAFTNDPDGPLSQALNRRTNTTYVAMAASEQAYNNINDRIQIYEGLLEELNNTEDLKASVDLQARISAENGLILSELMRLNAIQMQQRASIENEGLANRRRAAVANTYDAEAAGQAMVLENGDN